VLRAHHAIIIEEAAATATVPLEERRVIAAARPARLIRAARVNLPSSHGVWQWRAHSSLNARNVLGLLLFRGHTFAILLNMLFVIDRHH
jgi:hypothetical protein